MASILAGLAFSNAGLGAVHALAHSLGGAHDLPHGECNALLLPLVIEANFHDNLNAYCQFGRALGIGAELDACGTDDDQRDLVVGKVRNLMSKTGIEHGLASLGVRKEDLPRLAKLALNDVCLATNPRMLNAQELEQIYAKAL